MKQKTLEEKLSDIRKEAAEKESQTVRQYFILDKLGLEGKGYATPFVHFSKLWGASGSITFRFQRYQTIADGISPDADLLRYLLANFTPIDQYLVKDGCTSFRPAEPPDKPGMVTEKVYPVTVRVDVFQDRMAIYNWYAMIDSEIWQFQVEIPFHQTDLGVLDIRARYYGGDSGKVASYERCDIQPNHGARRIRWASGGPEYPNSFTLYWDEGTELDIPATVKV